MSHPKKRRTSYVSVSDSDSDLDLEEEDSIINSSLVHHNYNHQRPNQNNGSSGIDILLFASQLSSQLSSVNTGDAIASSRLPAAATTTTTTATAAVCTDTISCSSCVSLNGTANTSTTTTTTSMYQKMMTDRLTSMNNANDNEASKSKQSSDLLLSSANSMFVNSVLAASKKSKSTPRNNHKQAQVKIDLLEQHIRNKLMEKIQRNQLMQSLHRMHLRQCQTDDIQKYHQKYDVLYRRALLEIRSETIHQLRGQLNK